MNNCHQTLTDTQEAVFRLISFSPWYHQVVFVHRWSALDLQREGVLQGLAGSSHFPRSSFGGIFSSAGLPESQDFPETGPPPSSCPPPHAVPRRAYSSPLQFPKDAKSTRAVPADWEPFFHFLLFGRLLLNLQGPDSRSSLQSGSTPPSPGCQGQCSHLSVPLN